MKNNQVALILFIVALVPSANCQTSAASSSNRDLEILAADFWTWRAKYAPFTADDVNRIERPGGMRDWSRARIDNHRAELAEFEARWKKIEISGWPIPKQVDYRLIGSALSRVRWELDINPRWKRDPNFYIEQTLTAISRSVDRSGALYDEGRSREILVRIENIPAILQEGRSESRQATGAICQCCDSRA